jgi:preprotein translocase subunit SecG
MDTLTTIIIVVHVIVSLALIVMILLHAGRGGGMSDLFGGGMGPAAMSGSTVVERNLDRLTVVTAVTFAVTTMLLSWLLGR